MIGVVGGAGKSIGGRSGGRGSEKRYSNVV